MREALLQKFYSHFTGCQKPEAVYSSSSSSSCDTPGKVHAAQHSATSPATHASSGNVTAGRVDQVQMNRGTSSSNEWRRTREAVIR